MTEGRRPGGLTALAVINFIFAGSSFLSLAGLAAFVALADRIPTDKMDATQKAQIEALQNMGTPVLVVLLALTLLTGVLLLLSGIGYLKQKRVLGRMLGNTYAVIAIVSSLITGFMFSVELGGGFNLSTLLGLVYPLITLALVNTTFKDDLTN